MLRYIYERLSHAIAKAGMSCSPFVGSSNADIPTYLVYKMRGVVKYGDVERLVGILKSALAALHDHPEAIEKKLDEYKKGLYNRRKLNYQTVQQIVDRGAREFLQFGTPNEDLSIVDTITTDDIIDCIDKIADDNKELIFKVPA